MNEKCKYCLKALDSDGYCTACSLGRLLKRLAELRSK